jgi:hypothetical protein
MKKLPILAVIAVLIVAVAREQGVPIPGFPLAKEGADSALLEAYSKRQSDVQVQGEGVVRKILRDDLQGSRHQRFILELAGGQTVLIAHNIDLAPRIGGLERGDTVAFHGEYEWNPKGGVIHWTHHDPAGRHIDGWLKHAGKTYR